MVSGLGLGYTMGVCTGGEVLESTEHLGDSGRLATLPEDNHVQYKRELCSGTGVLVSVPSNRTLQINQCVFILMSSSAPQECTTQNIPKTGHVLSLSHPTEDSRGRETEVGL